MLQERKTPDSAWLAACLTVAALSYLFTMSTSITLVDAGLFHMVCADNGIAHPPGYPLATLLCHPYMSLPLPGTLPGNIFSISFALASLATLFFMARRLSFSAMEAALIALLLGTAWAFWSQAIVLEIYTLNTFLVLLLFMAALQFDATGHASWLAAAALVFGLGLANHWPLMMLSALATTPIFLKDPRAVKALVNPANLLACMAAVGLGLTPYLLMLDKPDAFMTMIGPVNSFDDLLLYASRSSYEDNSIFEGTRALDYLWWLPMAFTSQWAAIGWLLVPVGLLVSFRCLSRHVAFSLILLAASHCLLLPLLSNYSFHESLRYYYLSWTIPALISGAIWYFLGARFLLTAGVRQPRIFQALLMLVCLAPGVVNFTQTDPTDAAWVDRYNRLLLNSLPENAILFVERDAETGPLGYLHYVEGLRADIELRSRHNILFGNRLSDPRGFTVEQEQAIIDYLNTTARPIFFISDPPLSPAKDLGMFFAIGHTGFGTHAALDAYMAELIPALESNSISDPYIRFYLHEMLHQYARSIVGQALIADGIEPALAPKLAVVVSTLQGKTWTLHHMTRTKRSAINTGQLFSLIEAGEQQIDADTVETGAATFYRLAGDAFDQFAGNETAALTRYRQAMQYDHDNETCEYLAQKSALNYHRALDCRGKQAE